jgi:hypothetical protein
MRRSLHTAFVLGPAAALFFLPGLISAPRSASAEEVPAMAARACAGPPCSRGWMDSHLRLNQIQLVGTAESYKQRPSDGILSLVRMGGSRKDAQALDFALPPLAAQLDHDVRALEFDIVNDPQGGLFKSPAAASMAMDLLDAHYQAEMAKPGFKVMHVPDVDFRSSCIALADCLGEVARWSRAHPHHLPIMITLHPNDAKTPMPGAAHPLPFDAAALTALDAQLRAVFHANEVLTPDQVRAGFPTLRDAVTVRGWPRLGAVRGKVMFVLDTDAAKIAAYREAANRGEGGVMFVTADESAPDAAVLAIDDPVKDGARIQAAIKAGFLVKTRADDGTVEARAHDVARRGAAFASGAQIVATDFPIADPGIGPYRVSLEDDPRALCGAGLKPEHCVGMNVPEAVAAAR